VYNPAATKSARERKRINNNKEYDKYREQEGEKGAAASPSSRPNIEKKKKGDVFIPHQEEGRHVPAPVICAPKRNGVRKMGHARGEKKERRKKVRSYDILPGGNGGGKKKGLIAGLTGYQSGGMSWEALQ